MEIQGSSDNIHSFIQPLLEELRGSLASFQRGTKCEELHHMHRASLSDDFQFAVEAANHTCPHCPPILTYIREINYSITTAQIKNPPCQTDSSSRPSLSALFFLSQTSFPLYLRCLSCLLLLLLRSSESPKLP